MTLPGVKRFAAVLTLTGSLLGGLSGCNLPSGLLLSFDEANLGDLPAQVGLDVRFQPGLPLLHAAAEAPAAFRRLRGAAARLDLEQLSFGEASTILEGALLHNGMLVPLPAGILTIRTIAPEAIPVPVVPIGVAVPSDDVPSATEQLPMRQLPEVIGAYSAGRRTMVLATDGSYLMFGPTEPYSSGTFFLVGSRLELHPKNGDKVAFAQAGTESWRGKHGDLYTLIHEMPADEVPQTVTGKRRGGR